MVMKLENMLDRVVVIDNIEDEIKALADQLRSYDISVDMYVVGDDYQELPIFKKNRQLVFMDLMLDEDEGHIVTNISRVIQILNHIICDGFGPYGLVVWTKHTEKYEELLSRFTKAISMTSNLVQNQVVSNDADEISIDIHLTNPPLFIIDIDKIQFKSSGVWDFSNLMPILNQKIYESTASYFFLRWLSVTRQASQDTISDIYHLVSDYKSKEAEIKHVLCKLAKNHTGVNHLYPGLTADTYKAFSDIIHPRINALTSSEKLPDFSKIDPSYKCENEETILARLNAILFIDDVGIDQNEIVPGNIYEVTDPNLPVVVFEGDRIPFKRKNDQNKWEDYRTYTCIPIAIELTPPCDFSNKKVYSRIIGGYIADVSAHSNPKEKISGGDKGYIVSPIFIPNDDNIKYIIFDFRYLYTPADEQLKDPSKFKVLFRANHSLFSDILQKFSSHAARLGLKGLEP